MEGIGGIIWVVIIIAFTIINRSQKNAKSQQQGNNAQKNTTLQSQLNRAFQQINDIKNSASEQFNSPQQGNTPKAQGQNYQRPPAYQSSLEGYQMEGQKVEGYQMEGAKVEGYQVEGYKVEGLEEKHNTRKFDRKRFAVTESSMKRGYAGEGCDEHYDLGLTYSKSTNTNKKINKKSLYFSDNPIIQGLVMSQILERPKRRY